MISTLPKSDPVRVKALLKPGTTWLKQFERLYDLEVEIYTIYSDRLRAIASLTDVDDGAFERKALVIPRSNGSSPAPPPFDQMMFMWWNKPAVLALEYRMKNYMTVEDITKARRHLSYLLKAMKAQWKVEQMTSVQ